MSPIFTINLADFGRGAITAVLTAMVVAFYGIVTTPGFDLFMVDWHSTLSLMLNTGIAAFTGYIGKNFLTASNGKLFGRI